MISNAIESRLIAGPKTQTIPESELTGAMYAVSAALLAMRVSQG